MRHTIRFLLGLTAASVAGAAVAAGNVAAPWPYGWYPQPVYPGTVLLTTGYGVMAQNPYLPPPAATPQARPVVPVIPWPFFVVPQPQSPAPASSSAPVVAATQAPTLSDAAKSALAQAEADAKAARAAFTLWVPAENALNAAQEAAKEGDSAAVLRHAQTVSDLTRLGAEQAKYPSTESEPELSGDARVALAQAQLDAKTARAAYTLWVPAENALNAALQAAKEGDSAAVLKHAKTVSELTRLGTEQAKYPSTEMATKAVAKKKAKRKPKPKTKTKKAAVAKPATAALQAGGVAAQTTSQPSKVAEPTASAAPRTEAGAKQIRPRKLCWQGDRLEECP